MEAHLRLVPLLASVCKLFLATQDFPAVYRHALCTCVRMLLRARRCRQGNTPSIPCPLPSPPLLQCLQLQCHHPNQTQLVPPLPPSERRSSGSVSPCWNTLEAAYPSTSCSQRTRPCTSSHLVPATMGWRLSRKSSGALHSSRCVQTTLHVQRSN